METVPWYGWIAGVGVLAWGVMVIIGAVGYNRSKSGGGKFTQLIEQNTATNQALLAKLDTIETRLAAVEKTLTDIP